MKIVLIIGWICSKLKSRSGIASSFTVGYLSTGNASRIIVVKRSVETISSKSLSSSRVWCISDRKTSGSVSALFTLLFRRRKRVCLHCWKLFWCLRCTASQACLPSPGLPNFNSNYSNTLRAAPLVVNLKTPNRCSFAEPQALISSTLEGSRSSIWPL